MTIRDLVPEAFIRHIRMLQAKRRYPSAIIRSGRVAPSARIGIGCEIGYDVELGPRTRIGDYSYVNRGTIIASGNVGKFCSISYYCQIGMPEHPVEFASTSPLTYSARNIFGNRCEWEDFSAPPTIGNDVWIGSGAQVLQGATVGDGAIVAAGAIVTKDIPPYAIAIGTPARILKYRFPADQVDALLRTRWWDVPQDNANLFGTSKWQLGATYHVPTRT